MTNKLVLESKEKIDVRYTNLRAGDIVVHDGEGKEMYIVSNVAKGTYKMISLDCGNRYRDADYTIGHLEETIMEKKMDVYRDCTLKTKHGEQIAKNGVFK